MLAVMAADWRELVYRALIALLFGMTVLIVAPSRFVLLFILYTFADAIAALVLAFHVRGQIGFGSALLEGLVRVAAAFMMLAMARWPPDALAKVLAAWAGLSGIGQIGEAMALRGEMAGEWPLPIAGALSIVVAAILLTIRHVDMATLAWIIGIYALLWGVTLMVFAFRFRLLAIEFEIESI
ncbi:MAG TPA: DUF308 domain-containing protein [Vicinamibacterales bacterium]